MFVEVRVVGNPRVFSMELEHKAFDKAMGSEMDKVRGSKAVDGDNGKWMRRRWRRTTSHVGGLPFLATTTTAATHSPVTAVVRSRIETNTL